MIHLCLGDNSTLTLPDNVAIVSDPPYGIRNNCDYTRFVGGLSPNRNHHHGIRHDNHPFDPTRWLAYKHVVLFGYQYFAHRLPIGTVLVWLKKRDTQLGSFLSDCELAWMKGGKGCYLCKHIWHGFDRQTERGKTLHPSQKPVAVMRWLIEKAKIPQGTTIVDPYCGTGSTLLAAAELGYDAIGCEIEEAYHAVAIQRLEEQGVEWTSSLPVA